MWFLTCDGDHLAGKQVWLRPGSKHLFGRKRKPGDGRESYEIDHKSVSRQHFELSLAEVEQGASALVHKKSKLTITDLGSKAGTFVDSDKVQGASTTLDKSSHVIRMGNYQVLFRIQWRPIVLTLTGLSRSARQAEDPLAEYRVKVESLDIKCVTEYITQSTTHVVSKKRNTATSLQALVNGRSIVTEDYIDAISAAAEKVEAGLEGIPCSKLELDYDSNWPRELDYLPSPGAEPNPRAEHDAIFLPRQQRAEMFSNYIFIFTFRSQYDTFLPVITGGGGKAVLREVSPPEAQPDFPAFLEFVKSCAGKKGGDAFRLSQHPASKGGIVVVRPGDPRKIGGPDFFVQLDLALDQRSVEQNEFLEAILNSDASSLRRALEEDDEGEAEVDLPQRPPSNQQQVPFPQVQTPQTETEAPQDQRSAPATVKSRARRNFTRQKITTFDDFDPSQIVKYNAPSQHSGAGSVELSPVAESEAEMQDEDALPPNAPKSSQAQRGGKRTAESQLQPVETTSQVIDGILTGQAALKKRRLEAEKQGKSTFSGRATTPNVDFGDRPQRSAKEKELDLQRTIQARREEQERLRAEDEEKLRHAMDGVDISELKNLAQIETMHLPGRNRGKGLRRGDEDDPRWRPEWNGRANWKTFKKRRPGDANGQGGAQISTNRKVIVELRPYNPDEGTVVEQWLEQPTAKSRSSQGNSQSQHSSKQARSSHKPRSSNISLSSDRIAATPEGAAGATSMHDTATSTAATDDLRRRIEASRLQDEREMDETGLLPDEIAGVPRDPAVQAQLRATKDAEAQRRKEERDRRMNGRGGGTASSSAGGAGGVVDIPDSNGAAGRPPGTARSADATVSSSAGARVGTKRSREVVAVNDSDDSDDGQLRFRRRRRG